LLLVAGAAVAILLAVGGNNSSSAGTVPSVGSLTNALPAADATIVPELVRTGKLKIEARPIAFIGPDSLPARYAAIAAGSQNRMFNFMQVIYANQGVENTGWLNHAFIEKAASSVPGMQVQRLLDDQHSDAVIAVGKKIDHAANADNVSQTPTLFLGRTGGPLRMVSSKDTFDAARLAAAIRRLGGSG
jgi:protein-disulfide isomerase